MKQVNKGFQGRMSETDHWRYYSISLSGNTAIAIFIVVVVEQNRNFGKDSSYGSISSWPKMRSRYLAVGRMGLSIK